MRKRTKSSLISAFTPTKIDEKTYTWKKIQVFFNSEATIDQVAKAGKTFLIHLYGCNPRTSVCHLNHLRYTLFTQSATKARFTLARLPPTVYAARFPALRSYLQIKKWLRHEKIPLEWGWVPTRFGLSPCKMERDAAPESLSKIISCNCKNACGCRKTGLICSSLCTCSLGEACENVSDINLINLTNKKIIIYFSILNANKVEPRLSGPLLTLQAPENQIKLCFSFFNWNFAGNVVKVDIGADFRHADTSKRSLLGVEPRSY
ncbi:hypothetical protein AVEN_27752-1 [Araneus ventricosus]|uniref:Tesmin/TSO1-like CXC domain-containing protein n=1 Tax=Araneus ventricosus TaxID=182803 RepID=A0A4Y2VER7_ARAVE|nr:hypothetical protein AVEN_27752-1 [Araneus ventricosus]